MEHAKLSMVEKDDSFFAGAIFMSNRQTKRECLHRGLFGLPHSKYKFLKQLKSGMILFLFEHEERKLYGIFEATSDGTLNIIPDAFRTTGKSYPAQIRFKRIWLCKPLFEDEFRSAIEENYYTQNKFHFGLSFEQVSKLIRLFHLRRINIERDKVTLENTSGDDGSSTKTETYFKGTSDEYSREGKSEVRRKLAPYQPSLDPPMLYRRPDSTMIMQNTFSNTGRESNLSYPQNSYTETLNLQGCSIPLPHDVVPFHHFSIEKQPSTTSEIEYKPLPLHSSCYMPNLHDKVAPDLMGLKHRSSPDTVVGELYPNSAPIMPMIQEEDAFAPLHVMNDSSPQTEIVRRSRFSGAHPNHVFEFPGYISLGEESQQKHRENHISYVENSEYIPSTRLSCIPNVYKNISKHYYCSTDGYSDDDADDLKHYQRVEADEYNAFSNSLNADSDMTRTSVFSRLSRHQKIRNHESPEPSFGEQSEGSSLDQFLNVLSTRRSRWSSMEAYKQSMKWESNEKYGSTGLLDSSSENQNKITQTPIKLVETSALDSNLSNDVIAEESFELPFYNFRRRNANQEHEVRDDSNKHGDICGNEAKLSESKRRRIVRPSLYEKMDQNMNPELEEKISAPMKEQTEVEMSSQTILESKDEGKTNIVHRFLDSVVPVLKTVRKYEPVGELLEQNHVTSVDESLDYIPID